ncbi:hypothetical protein WJX73_002914 [Symbiochloris irregularis]|uniref:Uncharacterized protein n=1 Tax=Symbiochloris irregularis TaxID=706552 RepID=A0AAW1NLB2_9CHLO
MHLTLKGILGSTSGAGNSASSIQPPARRSVARNAALSEVVRSLDRAEQRSSRDRAVPRGDRAHLKGVMLDYLEYGEDKAELTRYMRERRRAGQESSESMLQSQEEAKAHKLAFRRPVEPISLKKSVRDKIAVIPNSAAFCKPEPQWFAVEVYYKEGTEQAVNPGRRIGVVGAWAERAMKTLKPVTLPNGEQVERKIETWIPKKRIKAVNTKTLRTGTKTLIWDNAETLLFKAIMDDDLAYYLERQMAPVSESLDMKVGVVSIRIAKQTGGRGMSNFGGAPTRTLLHRYKYSRKVSLLEKEVIEVPSRFGPGEQDELESRMVKKYRSNSYHLFPLPCPEGLIQSVQTWLDTEEEWDQAESIRNSKNIGLMKLFGVSEAKLEENAAQARERRAAEQAALKGPPPERQPRRRRRRPDDEEPTLTAEQQARELFNPGWNVGSVPTSFTTNATKVFKKGDKQEGRQRRADPDAVWDLQWDATGGNEAASSGNDFYSDWAQDTADREPDLAQQDAAQPRREAPPLRGGPDMSAKSDAHATAEEAEWGTADSPVNPAAPAPLEGPPDMSAKAADLQRAAAGADSRAVQQALAGGPESEVTDAELTTEDAGPDTVPDIPMKRSVAAPLEGPPKRKPTAAAPEPKLPQEGGVTTEQLQHFRNRGKLGQFDGPYDPAPWQPSGQDQYGDRRRASAQPGLRGDSSQSQEPGEWETSWFSGQDAEGSGSSGPSWTARSGADRQAQESREQAEALASPEWYAEPDAEDVSESLEQFLSGLDGDFQQQQASQGQEMGGRPAAESALHGDAAAAGQDQWYTGEDFGDGWYSGGDYEK